MNKNHYIAIVAIIVVVGGGAFYGGMQYGVSKTKAAQVAARGNFGGGAGANGGQRSSVGAQGGQNGGQRMNGGASGGFANGSIISKDDKSITVKSQDGSSKIIFFSDSTTIGKATSGSVSDLATGQQVMVNGKTNSDGTITAQNIQIRPAETNQPTQ